MACVPPHARDTCGHTPTHADTNASLTRLHDVQKTSLQKEKGDELPHSQNCLAKRERRRWELKRRKCGLRTLPLHQRTSGRGEGQAPREPVQTAGWGTGRPTAPLPSSGAWWPSKRPEVLEVSAVSVCPRPSRPQCASASSRDAVLPQYGAVCMGKKSGWGQNTAFREARAPSCLWRWLLITMTFLASPHLSVSGYGGWITIPSARQIREEKNKSRAEPSGASLFPSPALCVKPAPTHSATLGFWGMCLCVSRGPRGWGERLPCWLCGSQSAEEGGLEFF